MAVKVNVYEKSAGLSIRPSVELINKIMLKLIMKPKGSHHGIAHI